MLGDQPSNLIFARPMPNRPLSRIRRSARKEWLERQPPRFDVPKSLKSGRPYALWSKGGPGRLLRWLAVEGAGGEIKLTPEELADLVELFSDEPLPDNLRVAVIQHLRGKRLRKQGSRRKRQSALEQVELVMLPGAYAEALKDAEIERTKLRGLGKKKGRYDDPSKLPTASSIACALVKKRLPTLKDQSDRSLLNLVSKAKKQLVDEDDDPPSPQSGR